MPLTSPPLVVPDHPTGRWPEWLPGLALRALQTLGVGLLVAIFLAVALRHRFWIGLLYAECIALACWAFIDGGRALVGRWVHRHDAPGSVSTRGQWPGMGWIAVILVLGTLGGITVGTALADALSGVRSVGNLGNLRVLAAVLLISIVPGTAITYFAWSMGRLQAERARTEAALRQAAENQLRLLESQLEPHMLFNTLANLRVLIGLDAPRAQVMLDHLIAFLRATLSASRVAQHPLEHEFARVTDYLALMKIRMGERLQTTLLLPEALAAQPVPPLLLQPLVENAIKHGLEPHVEGGHLQLEARAEGGQLLLLVHDTGVGLQRTGGSAPGSDTGTGFGLQQVRERLAALYGDRASLSLEAADPLDAAGGTRASVRLPLSAVDAPLGAVQPTDGTV